MAGGRFNPPVKKDRPGTYINFRSVKADSSVVPAPVVDHIEIRRLPDKTSFFDGEALDYTGVSVVAVMSDGGERDVTADCTFDPADGAIVSV